MNSSPFIIHPLRKTLVYHFGQEAGFYSEFNNMVLGILYCYKHHLNFVLYSKDANFGFYNGWTDYFLPFCKEVTNSFHSKYNYRQPINIPKGLLYNIRKNLYKTLFHFNYYTYDLWNNFRCFDFEKETFTIDDKKDMSLLDSANYVINKILRYNGDSQAVIDELVRSVSLPSTYAGLHIRRGDKVIEHKNESIDNYIQKLKKYTDIKDVYVSTDSYEVFLYLRKFYPQYRFYSLVDETERGYFHQEFINKSVDFKKKATLKLFSSIEILSRAEYCIGTFNSNIGMFLGMLMPNGRMIGVDYDCWRIW